MMATVERITNDSTQVMTNAKNENGKNNQQTVSLTSVSSTPKRGGNPPLHFGRVAVELSTIKDITTGIRDEVSAYSNLERRYVRELEKKLPKCEGMGDIRMHMTVDQLERIRRYRRSALAELTDMTVKIAALESRVERIAFEAAEAELNVKLAELEALYCGPEIDVISPATGTTQIPAEPKSIREKATIATTTTTTTTATTQSLATPNATKTKASVIIPAYSPKEKMDAPLVVPTPEIAKTPLKVVEEKVQDIQSDILNANRQEVAEEQIKSQIQIQSQSENTRPDIPSSISTFPPTNMSNKQIVALRDLLTEYKHKKVDPLSTSETDNVVENDSTSSVESGSDGTMMQQQLEDDEDDGESIADLLKEARESRHKLSAHSIKLPTHISGKNKKLVIAAGAGSSVAAGIWMLEARTGMISRAFSGMLRMLG